MYTKKYLASYLQNGTRVQGCRTAKNGQKFVTLLICSEATQDRGVRVTSFNPKDIAKCSDGEGNWLADEVIDALAEEHVDNFDKVAVDLDGVYYRIDNGNYVIDEKTGRPAEYTQMKVAVMWSEKWDFLFVDGKPFINPVTGAFDKYPVCDAATGRPKRFYDQGWSPEERVASMIEAGFYVKANIQAQPVAQPNPAQAAAPTPAQAAAQAAQAAASAVPPVQPAPVAPATA